MTVNVHDENLRILAAVACVLEHMQQATDKCAEYTEKCPFGNVIVPAMTPYDYIIRLQKYFKCSPACFIAALMYVDRLVARSWECDDGGEKVTINQMTIHRLMLLGLIISVKFWEDASYSNKFYARVGGIEDVQELNRLELEFLNRLDYKLQISLDDFAAYRTELLAHTRNCIKDPCRQLLEPHAYHQQQQQQQQQPLDVGAHEPACVASETRESHEPRTDILSESSDDCSDSDSGSHGSHDASRYSCVDEADEAEGVGEIADASRSEEAFQFAFPSAPNGADRCRADVKGSFLGAAHDSYGSKNARLSRCRSAGLQASAKKPAVNSLSASFGTKQERTPVMYPLCRSFSCFATFAAPS